MSIPCPAPNGDSSEQASRSALQQVMFNFAQDVCERQEKATKDEVRKRQQQAVEEEGHAAKRRAYNPAETAPPHSGPSRYPPKASFPQQPVAPTSPHAPISRQFDRSIFSAREESSLKPFDVDGFREQQSQKSQAPYNFGTMGEASSPDFGTAIEPFQLAPFGNAPVVSVHTSPLSPPCQASNIDPSTSTEAIHGGTVTQKDASPNVCNEPSTGGPHQEASVPHTSFRCIPQSSSFIAESVVPSTCYYDSNAYRWATSPPDANDVLPPAPQLPLPPLLYHESETADRNDEVTRAQKALRDHMKNRWKHVFDASRKFQDVMGVSPGKGPRGAPGVTIKEALPRHEPPRKFELLPGFDTPQTARDHERQQRSRTLRDITNEHRHRPSRRSTQFASLSIHQVSGDLDADGARRRSQNSASVRDSSLQGPLKLHNELLAHYASSPGTSGGVGTGSTDIIMFEIDMPRDPNRESRSSLFERWLVFEISMPFVFCVPGEEASQIATIYPELHGGQNYVSSAWIAAPVADLIVENAKPIQDILTDGTPCLRQDYTFGPNVRHRLEFSGKPSALDHFPEEWLSANMEIDWFTKGPETNKEYERHEKPYEMAIKEGVQQDIARWDKIRHALATGACRIVSRVVDEERIEKMKKSETKRAAKATREDQARRKGLDKYSP